MDFLTSHMVAPKLALETATRLALEFTQPILGKIEPYDLGAFALDNNLARNYCERICRPSEDSKKTQTGANCRRLVENYPAHEFTIDRSEASSLGLNVSEPSDEIEDLFDELREDLETIHLYAGLVSYDEVEI